MTTHRYGWMLIALCIAGTAMLAYADGGDFDLSWFTIDSGGGSSSGGAFDLSGTIGQPDAATSTGGIFELRGGFWRGGSAGTISVADDSESTGSAPLAFQVHAARPNPFNPRTTIGYELPYSGGVRIAIYDVKGALVRLLVDRPQPAGRYTVAWDGRQDDGSAAASGVYLVRTTADQHSDIQKITLLK